MTTDRPVRPVRTPMTTERKSVLAAGVLYIVTFLASIPTLGLYDKVLHHTHWLLGTESAAAVRWGAFGDVVCGLTGIGTAVFLYRVLKAHSPNGAVGFVASRTLEAAMLFVGAVSVLAMVTLRQDATAATEHASLLVTGRGLVAVHDWTFLLGPGLMPAVNALCFATILARTRLVPRIIPTVGLVGAVCLTVSFVASLFGAWDQVSSAALLMAMPIALWEFTIGVWMIVKGFRSPSVAAEGADRVVAAV